MAKIDRLYAITVYLLNNGKATSRELAQKFEVSVRTIQRDIDSLCKAGIPVAAEAGANGGYSISEAFRMNAQTATNEDYALILTALKGYYSATDNPKINATLEKIASLTKKPENGVILDFSVQCPFYEGTQKRRGNLAGARPKRVSKTHRNNRLLQIGSACESDGISQRKNHS